MDERLDAVEDEFLTVEAELSDPAVLNDSSVLRQKSKRYHELTPIVGLIREHRAAVEDAAAATELLLDASADERDMMRAELQQAEGDIARLAEEIRLLLLPRDPNDGKAVIVEIRGAEGGEEANLFARDLFDMYSGYAAQEGWTIDVLSSDTSDLGGLNQITFMIKGDTAWGRMKFEGGTHRVQRVPVTESQGRIHTSSATVLILAEAEEVEVEIDEKDLQIDVYRASGPGGQGVNTTDSRVELTFDLAGSPSLDPGLRERAVARLGTRLVDGTVTVTASEQRSQLQNRQAAERRLADLLAAAFAPPPPPRRPTRPSRASVRRRVEAKKRRGQTKRWRGSTED